MEAVSTQAFFTHALLDWYDLNGRKNLPWQNQGPYAVWLSEIMLQQTQVKTAIPYYQTFIARFLNISSLAEADQDEVLHYWYGLGYYRRAVNLHKAAQILLRNHAATLPDNYDDLITLPGIGASTAAAILAQAYNQPVAIFDANVKRVLSRFHAVESDIGLSSTQDLLRNYARDYVSNLRPAAYTQAIMDLGALVCQPRRARCDVCPLQQRCLAEAKGLANSLPVKSAKRRLPEVSKLFIIFVKADKTVFLQKRDYAAVWQGLWSLPELDLTADITELARCFSFVIKNKQKLDVIKHIFSHYILYMHPIYVEVSAPGKIQQDNSIWYHPENKLGLPKPVDRLIQLVSKL